MVHWRGDPAAAREILVNGALRVEPADGHRALELLASAQHPSWLCGRRELLRETAAALAGRSGRSEIRDDARLAAVTGAAMTICEQPDDAAAHLRRAIALASDDDPFALVYAAMSAGWLCEYRAARDLATRALEIGRAQGAAASAAFASEVLAEFSRHPRRFRRSERDLDRDRGHGRRGGAATHSRLECHVARFCCRCP